MSLGFACDVPRVAGERSFRICLDDVAYKGDSWNLAEWIYESGLDVGDE